VTFRQGYLVTLGAMLSLGGMLLLYSIASPGDQNVATVLGAVFFPVAAFRIWSELR
jgi:hypothetical protein